MSKDGRGVSGQYLVNLDLDINKQAEPPDKSENQSIKQGLWRQWARLCQVLGQQFVSNASAQRELGSRAC